VISSSLKKIKRIELEHLILGSMTALTLFIKNYP